MLSKLTRILLALVTALVFTGQMEAAAEHCARLSKEAAAAPASEAAPECHEPAPAAVHGAHHAAPSHAPAQDPAHAPTTHTADHCECVAALNGFTNISGALASGHVVPYAWLPPEAASFASSRPDPDLRPPRA